jgi:hypothetical protein
MATLEIWVTIPFKELKIAMPLRKVDNKIVWRELLVSLQVLKPLLE